MSETPITALLYFFRWYPGHNSALLANSHRPDVCLPASGWKQTGDFGVKDYAAAPGLNHPVPAFRVYSLKRGGELVTRACLLLHLGRSRSKRKRKFRPQHVDHTVRLGSARADRAVLDGRRHLGQQVMEYLMVQTQPPSAEQAEAYFSTKLPDLIAVPSKPL